MSIRKMCKALVCSLILIIVGATTVFADVQLPDGAVKGLPEKISAMDSSGNLVNSASGEYFFHVENMTYGEVYTKDVQLMNLCDDKAYNIYFYVEPVPESKKGDIDLEEGCICSFYFDGEKFYEGSVTGIGNIDLTKEAKLIGYYEPGDAHILSCSIAWVGDSGDYHIDEGHRLADSSGAWVLRPPEESGPTWGEIEFKWIFSAAVNQSYMGPKTGLLAIDGKIWIACMVVVAVLIAVVLVLLNKKKKQRKVA